MAQQQLLGQGFLIVQASRSYSDTTHCVGLLWTRGQPDAEKKNPKIHKRQDFHGPAGFEPTVPANERPQTHALDREATGMDIHKYYSY